MGARPGIDLGCLLAALLSISCAPALSSFSPAHVPEKGHVQAEAGTDVSAPAGALSTLRSAGKSLEGSASDKPLSDDEQRELTRSAWALATNPPSLTTHLGVGVGLAENLELQGRLTSGAWRVAGRYQLLDQAEHGVDFTTGLGMGRFKSSLDALDILDVVEFDDFTRWQVDLLSAFGQHGDWYRWWGGPRVAFVTYEAGMSMTLPAIEEAGYAGSNTAIDLSGSGWYLGGQVGGALGYKRVFLAVELTVAQFLGGATLRTSGGDSLGTYRVDSSGLVVVPGVGLLGEF